MMSYTDYMIDIETLGKGNDALILSIGVMPFFLGDKPSVPPTGSGFSVNINVESSQLLGAKMDASTILWWMTQDDNARDIFGGITDTLPHALDRLTSYLNVTAGSTDIVVWGNGSTFDISILEDNFRLAGMKEPWNFRNVRDMRTMVDLYGRMDHTVRMSRSEEDGYLHTALGDAVHQARKLVSLQRQLNTVRSGPGWVVN
jgi:exodeoxyribonuclease VIII